MKFQKKSLAFALGGILLLLAGFALGRTSIPKEFSSHQPPLTMVLSPTTLSTSSLTEETLKVTRVIDGDTIEIEGGQRVRYIGIDAPEPNQCFGPQATAANLALVAGKKIRLESDVEREDKYHRLLAYVWVEETLVNEKLVRDGLALVTTYPPNVKYQERFLAAQKEAKEASLGLWSPGACAFLPSTASEQPGCKIKGNISSSLEKIYHLPNCGSYSKTKIDEGRGERWFCSEEEAQAAGWRKALNCP